MTDDPRPTPANPPGRPLARTDIEAVIRRATELTLSEADARDQISEDELERIAAEVGLPAQHVRRALHERAVLRVRPRWYDRWFGSPLVAESRPVASRADATLRGLEQYLCTREYLQVVRRRTHEIALIPAEDTISRVARVLARPGGRFGLARAERVVLGVRPLDEESAHVRIETDYSGARSSYVTSGGVVGGMLGLLVGTIIEISSGGALGLGYLGGALGGSAVGLGMAARDFRSRLGLARRELAHLLDRVETGQRLEPPPPPWRRNLQERLFGTRR